MSRRDPLVVLVTGFGRFPAAPQNPTAALVAALRPYVGRLRRLGIRLELAVLPVVYDEVEARLLALVAASRPDAILHFGLAGRRRLVSVETRAVNRLGVLHPDAARRRAGRRMVVPEGQMTRPARYPAARVAVAIERTGVTNRLSIDAGDYVCNQVLYLSLARTDAVAGFIHVPRLMRRDRPAGVQHPLRPTLDALTRAAFTAVLTVAQTARRGF